MDNKELYSRLSRYGRIDHYESGRDRRREPRVMVFVKGTLHHDDHHYRVVTRDLSRSGVGLISQQSFEVGCSMQLDLELPWEETISRRVKILRCEESSDFYDIAALFE